MDCCNIQYVERTAASGYSRIKQYISPKSLFSSPTRNFMEVSNCSNEENSIQYDSNEYNCTAWHKLEVTDNKCDEPHINPYHSKEGNITPIESKNHKTLGSQIHDVNDTLTFYCHF